MTRLDYFSKVATQAVLAVPLCDFFGECAGHLLSQTQLLSLSRSHLIGKASAHLIFFHVIDKSPYSTTFKVIFIARIIASNSFMKKNPESSWQTRNYIASIACALIGARLDLRASLCATLYVNHLFSQICRRKT